MDIVSVGYPSQAGAAVTGAQSSNPLTAIPGLVSTVQGINAAQLFGADSELTLAIDQQTRLPVIRIISRQTDQVVMQVPAEYILQLHQSLQSRPDIYQQSDAGAADQDGPDPSNSY